MAKLLVFFCLVLIAATFVTACSPPGFLCGDNKDCCAPFVCNPWAGRCTKAPSDKMIMMAALNSNSDTKSTYQDYIKRKPNY